MGQPGIPISVRLMVGNPHEREMDDREFREAYVRRPGLRTDPSAIGHSFLQYMKTRRIFQCLVTCFAEALGVPSTCKTRLEVDLQQKKALQEKVFFQVALSDLGF